MEVAERIREQVADLWVGQDRAATISIGVAVLDGHRDAEDLLEQADKAMYAAKQAGRDRVVRADTLEPRGPPRRRSSRPAGLPRVPSPPAGYRDAIIG